jgi:hypothetical protein
MTATVSRGANGPDLIELAIASVNLDNRSKRARVKFIDALIAEGFTFENTAAYGMKADGTVSPENKRMRDRLMTIALAAISINDKRLNMTQVAEIMSDDRAPRKLYHGIPASLRGVTNWYGNATSQTTPWRKELKAREVAAAAATEGEDAPTVVKTAKTPVLVVREALAKIEDRVKKAEPGAFDMDIPAFLAALRELNKLVK